MMTMIALAIALISILSAIVWYWLILADIDRFSLIVIGRASFTWRWNLCHVFHNIEKGKQQQKQKQLQHGKSRAKQQQDLTSAPWQ